MDYQSDLLLSLEGSIYSSIRASKTVKYFSGPTMIIGPNDPRYMRPSPEYTIYPVFLPPRNLNDAAKTEYLRLTKKDDYGPDGNMDITNYIPDFTKETQDIEKIRSLNCIAINKNMSKIFRNNLVLAGKIYANNVLRIDPLLQFIAKIDEHSIASEHDADFLMKEQSRWMDQVVFLRHANRNMLFHFAEKVNLLDIEEHWLKMTKIDPKHMEELTSGSMYHYKWSEFYYKCHFIQYHHSSEYRMMNYDINHLFYFEYKRLGAKIGQIEKEKIDIIGNMCRFLIKHTRGEDVLHPDAGTMSAGSAWISTEVKSYCKYMRRLIELKIGEDLVNKYWPVIDSVLFVAVYEWEQAAKNPRLAMKSPVFTKVHSKVPYKVGLIICCPFAKFQNFCEFAQAYNILFGAHDFIKNEMEICTVFAEKYKDRLT